MPTCKQAVFLLSSMHCCSGAIFVVNLFGHAFLVLCAACFAFLCMLSQNYEEAADCHQDANGLLLPPVPDLTYEVRLLWFTW